MKEYNKAIKAMLKLKGIEETNAANHAALETGMITVEMFQSAAKIIVAAYMER